MAEATPWLTEGTPEKIVLDALQQIAFEDVDDPIDVAQHALHGAGFATLGMVYGGSFHMQWLKDGEKVKSAGDGTSAAIVVSPDGSERRYDVGDEVWLGG